MRKQLLCGVAAIAVTAALTGPIRAADMAAKAPPPAAPPVAALPNWTGFYLGATLGYGWTKVQGDESNTPSLSVHPQGALVGVHSGYNWQSGQWVLGIETDYSGTLGNSWSKSVFTPALDTLFGSGLHGELNGLSSIRARLGWAFDRTLIYATGGWGWGWYKSIAGASGILGNPASHTVNGAVAGAGIEWRYSQNFSFRLEGMNYFFNKHSGPTSSDLISGNDTIKNVALIRFGGSYHF